jgi:hypothetical protein
VQRAKQNLNEHCGNAENANERSQKIGKKVFIRTGRMRAKIALEPYSMLGRPFLTDPRNSLQDYNNLKRRG